jgi:hypothetical protein
LTRALALALALTLTLTLTRWEDTLKEAKSTKSQPVAL